MLRLLDRDPIGKGVHRSGWPYVISILRPLHAADGILFDDFVECTFIFRRKDPSGLPYRRPWIGVFHLPPRVPPWALGGEHNFDFLFRQPYFVKSLRRLKTAVCLSEHSAQDLRKRLNVPVHVVKLPAEMAEVKFDPQAFRENPNKAIVQLGWYYRNTRVIEQLRPVAGFRRVRRLEDTPWARAYHQDVAANYGRDRPVYPGVETPGGRLPDDAYDQLLSRNVVFTELLASSANNLVLECLVRATPLVVNRHPAVEEYLGPGYPLFYERMEDAHHLFTETRLLEGHEHLKRLDKSLYSAERFQEAIRSIVAKAGGNTRLSCRRHEGQ